MNNRNWCIRKKIIEEDDKKKWKEIDKVYGVYDNNDTIKYIGRDIKYINEKYTDYVIKEFEKGLCKNINWEVIYISWYSLKYNLDNKLHKIKPKKFIEFKNEFKSYYDEKYLYKSEYIKRLDIVLSISISKTIEKSIKTLHKNGWKLN